MSNSQSKNWFRFAWHPTEEELLLFLDGEVGDRQSARVCRHLEQCWSCRNRRDKFNAAIAALVDYCEDQTNQSASLPRRASLEFTERLRHTAAQTEPAPLARWRINWHWRLADLRLALATATALLLVGVMWLIFQRAERPVSGQELLRRATQAETLGLQRVNEPVVYCKLQVKRTAAQPVMEKAVEWESWSNARQQRFRQHVANQPDARALLGELEQILRHNHLDAQHPLSVTAFAAWRNSIRPQSETVVKNHDSLVLTASVVAPHALHAIRKAALSVRQSDWHVVALQLQVQGEHEIRSYELREIAYEILPSQALTVFAEATPAFVAPGRSELTLAPSLLPTAAPVAPATVTPTATALAALELDVLERLNQVNALLGEQLNLTRTNNGQLKIEGVVETDARKAELLRALQSAANNPAIKIDISTVAEAQTRQAQSSQPRKVIIQDAQVRQQFIPVETELRSYFSARGLAGEWLEQEIQQFSAQICGRSSRARAHALALKQIADRFSATQLSTLDQTTSERWRTLLNQHANGFRREWQQLRQQLQPIFPVAAETGTSASKLNSDEELLNAISRLFKLAATNDAALCQSFSVSTEAAAGTAVKRAEFWRTVSTTETLATQIVAWQ